MAMPVAHLGRPAWRHSSVEDSGGQAVLDITLYLPGNASLPCPISEHSTEQAFTHGIEVTGSGLHHVVTFADLPEHIDLALQAIGECVRIPGAWAAVGGQRMSSLVALWNRLDCYRQSLSCSDRVSYCRNKAASVRAGLGCGLAFCSAPCQFLCPLCTLKDTSLGRSIVHPETQVLAVLGEIDWCPNLIRSTDQ